MTGLLLIALVVAAAIAVIFFPLLFAARRRGDTALLARYQEIIEALLTGEVGRAREQFKEIVRADTEDVAGFLRLARIFRQSGDVERSLAVHRSLLARDLRNRRLRLAAWEGLITDLLLLHRFQEAQVAGEQLEALDRRNPYARRAAFYYALEREEWTAAFEALAALKRSGTVRGDPEPFQVRTFVAGRLSEAGDLREARRLLDEARKANPRFVPAALLLGDLWSREGNHAEAAAVWTELLRDRPEAAPHVIPRLERAYFETGRFSDLAQLYEELAAQVGARVPILRLALARIALRKGDAQSALRAVETDGASRTGDIQTICWRCYYLLEVGETAAAQALLKETIEAAIAEPESPICLHCGSAVPANAARCASCLGWLPDPVVRRGPGAHRSTS